MRVRRERVGVEALPVAATHLPSTSGPALDEHGGPGSVAGAVARLGSEDAEHLVVVLGAAVEQLRQARAAG